MSKLTKYSAAVLAAGAMFAATQNAWAGPNDIVGSTTGTASGTVATPEETPDTTPKPVVLASWGGAAPVATEEAPATPKPIVLSSWGGAAPVATPAAEGLPKAKLTDAELIKKYKLKPDAYLKLNRMGREDMLFEIMEKVESDEEAIRIGCILNKCNQDEINFHAENLPLGMEKEGMVELLINFKMM